MPWARLAAWFSMQRAVTPRSAALLTLVTLTVVERATLDEIDFYSDAEVAALTQWAKRGAFILALTTVGRDELTLLCPSGQRSTRNAVKLLPMVSAGLAEFNVRGVLPLSVRSMVSVNGHA